MNAIRPPESASRPLVSILLIAHNQEHVIAEAVRGALAQTWEPLEIILSDDASRDDTWAQIQASVRDYQGSHRLIVRRNAENEGISAHLSRLAALAQGELLFVAAGDDISLPERCARVVQHWLARDCRPDLIATDLLDMDSDGAPHERIIHADLESCRSFEDWAARQPRLIGASHAWSRRLFERFGPMQPGTGAEDQIMVFRAIVSGGASNLHEPLVRYRRGGLSGKRRYASVAEFTARQRQSNRFGWVATTQLQQDADTAGLGEKMRAFLAPKRAREMFIEAMFNAPNLAQRMNLALRARNVKPGLRLRMFLYAACPMVYAPVFRLKRALGR